MQQIKGDKIWIFIGYRVPVLMKSIFSHDATTRTFPHLSPKKRHSKVCKTIWILSDDREGTCGFMKSKLCRTRAREEFGGSTRYLDNIGNEGGREWRYLTTELAEIATRTEFCECPAIVRMLCFTCQQSKTQKTALCTLPCIENAPITCWSIQEQKLQQMFVNTSMLLKWLLATVPLNGQSRQRSLWGETKTLTSKAFWLVNSRSWCLELLQFHTYKICFSIYPTYINLSTSASR